MSFKSPLQREDGSPFSKMTPNINHYIPIPFTMDIIYVNTMWDKVGVMFYISLIR